MRTRGISLVKLSPHIFLILLLYLLLYIYFTSKQQTAQFFLSGNAGLIYFPLSVSILSKKLSLFNCHCLTVTVYKKLFINFLSLVTLNCHKNNFTITLKKPFYTVILGNRYHKLLSFPFYIFHNPLPLFILSLGTPLGNCIQFSPHMHRKHSFSFAVLQKII